MPSLHADPFPALIRSLPEHEHSVAVRAKLWRPKFAATNLMPLWEAVFVNGHDVRLSRGHLLNHPHPGGDVQKCVEVLLWGYPGGGQGNLVLGLLPHLDQIAELAQSDSEWLPYFDALDAVPGLNISTITKLAYFYRRSFAGHDAVILDSSLIKNTARWDETNLAGLAYHNAHRRYPAFLEMMHGVAADLECSAAQLELFLFSLGNNF